MTKEQAGGYIFESVIWKLLKRSGYVKVKGKKLKGRGAVHQIDAVGYWRIPIPFVYPIRFLLEAKFKDTSHLEDIRNFFGVFADINENYFVRGNSHSIRYTDAACVCCRGSFTIDAQNYAWAHNIFLISFCGVESLRKIISDINVFLEDANLEKSRKEILDDFNERVDIEKPHVLMMGMLDGKYPIMLSSSRVLISFLKEHGLLKGDRMRGIKTLRSTNDFETVYKISYVENEEIPIEFSLPNTIARKINKHIDRIPNGHKVFSIEIPAINKYKNYETRRIFKIDVILG